MQVNSKIKLQIVEAIRQDMAAKSGKAGAMTNTRHANTLGISSSIYSRLMKGETDKVLSEGEWVRIGMQLGVDMDGLGIKLASTPTYDFITAQLAFCQQNSLSAIFCDKKGIGKTVAAKSYARQNANVAYLDCSQCKTKREFIRAIARAFGFEYEGKLAEVRQNMVDNILTLHKPLLILDEAGDLNFDAWLERKALWNALEYQCGFYSMGANGLQKKIEKQIRNRTVGYEEIMDRDGDRFQQITKKMTETEVAQFDRVQAECVLKVNLPKLGKDQFTEMINSSARNLRRLRIEIVKHKAQQAS